LSATRPKQNGQTKLAWLATKSVFIIHAAIASDAAIENPVNAHPVTHASRRGNSFCRLQLIHATSPIHNEMNSVGTPKWMKKVVVVIDAHANLRQSHENFYQAVEQRGKCLVNTLTAEVGLSGGNFTGLATNQS